MATTFKPAANPQVSAITIAASAALLGIGCLFLFLSFKYRERATYRYIFLGNGSLMLFLLLGALNFRISAYAVEDHTLVIRHGVSAERFPLEQLREAQVVESPFQDSRRDFGVGGFWSFYGRFSSQRLGPFKAYATSTQRGVLLRLPDQQVLITPADLEGFMRLMKTKP